MDPFVLWTASLILFIWILMKLCGFVECSRLFFTQPLRLFLLPFPKVSNYWMSFYCSFWNVPLLWLDQFLIDSANRWSWISLLDGIAVCMVCRQQCQMWDFITYLLSTYCVNIVLSLDYLWQTIIFPPKTIDKGCHIHGLDSMWKHHHLCGKIWGIHANHN